MSAVLIQTCEGLIAGIKIILIKKNTLQHLFKNMQLGLTKKSAVLIWSH